ncbi:hypothetical protein C2G38_2175870 [Gigaspora rosea]|uniref:CCHC-type domain-containing protein n=1 Tax=Gigaspora rosea TaxID=44941 RepID=A0A397VGT7_9GLOM|nr:hypothetical protein C2G38_2175870 [Gigaspora rosea]
MLCKELSEVGTKQALVVRLASRIVDKARKKDRGKENNQSNNRREGRVDTDLDLQYIALEKSLKQIVQVTMENVVNDFRKCMQCVDEYKHWAKKKINKPRDQFEYDEWCRVGRVDKREDWNIATEIKNSSDEEIMNAYFKITSTSIANTTTVSASTILNLTLFQPVYPTFGLNMTLSYRNVMPDQSLYQQQYRSQGYSEMYGNSRLFRQSRNPGVVCFICEEQGHIAWDCPQKNMAEEQMLFSKGMKLLVQMKVLRQIEFIGDELEWVEQELERLMKMQAVKLIYKGRRDQRFETIEPGFQKNILFRRLGRIVEDDQEKLREVVPLYSSAIWPILVTVDFSKIMRALIGLWRSQGIYCRNHINDVWQLGANKAKDLWIDNKFGKRNIRVPEEKVEKMQKELNKKWSVLKGF